MIQNEFAKIPKFVWYFLLALGFWYFVYEVFLKPASIYDDFIIAHLVNSSVEFLNALGYHAYGFDFYGSGKLNCVSIDGHPGVNIGSNCDGLILIALFVIFMSFIPGPSRYKIVYLPVGVVLIHVLNIFRISMLCIIMATSPEYLKFNHDYTFTVLTYGFVFSLWVIWVKKFLPADKK